MTDNPPTQELLKCPVCTFWKDETYPTLKALKQHIETHDKSEIAWKLSELIAQEGKIKERIEQRMKEIHPKASAPSSYKDIAVFKESEAWTLVYKELKDLLDKKSSINITESNTVIENKHIYSDENGIHMEDRDKE